MDQIKPQFALCALFLVTACSSETPPLDKESEPVALVKIARAQTGTSAASLLLYGAVEAVPGSERALISPSEAILSSIVAPNGTAVCIGQVIAVLRASPTTRLELKRARIDLASANSAYARARRLRADGLVSDAEVETTRAAVASAQALQSSLGARAAGLALQAPIAGTVQALTAKPGELIAASATVATIAARGNARARFGVEPAIAQRASAGMAIKIEPLGGGSRIDAVVTGVDQQIDPQTRLAALYARLPSLMNAAPGQPLRATLFVGGAVTGVAIPHVALLDDGGKPYVFMIEKDVAHRRDLVLGNSLGDMIAITSGVSSGEAVVIDGGTALKNESKVRFK
jgi:RND family efflux transporter MFP subunit